MANSTGLRQTRRDVLKRLAATAAMAGVGGPLLSACASSSAPESLAFADDLGSASLTALLRGSFIESIDQLAIDLAAGWEADRNASIELILHEEFRTEVLRVAQERGGADLGQLFGNQPHILSEQLADVSELAESIGDSNGGWSDFARQSCVVDGAWRAVPWSTTRHVFTTRTDILNEIGVDQLETYEGLLESANLLVEHGLPPIGVTMSEEGPADSGAFAYAMLWSFGGQELSDDGRVAIDSSETRAALEYFRELSAVNAAGALAWTHPDNNEAFLSGQISCTQNPTSIFVVALEQGLPIVDSIGHSPLPAGPAGQFDLPEIDSLGVFTHSMDKTAAFDWIGFVNQRSVLIDRAQKSLAFFAPLVLGLEDDPAMPWNTDPRLAGLSKTSVGARAPGWPLPPSLEAGLVYENTSIVKMFNAVGTGEATVEEAVRTTTDSLRRVYET